jgi:hypothetical protein
VEEEALRQIGDEFDAAGAEETPKSKKKADAVKKTKKKKEVDTVPTPSTSENEDEEGNLDLGDEEEEVVAKPAAKAPRGARASKRASRTVSYAEADASE